MESFQQGSNKITWALQPIWAMWVNTFSCAEHAELSPGWSPTFPTPFCDMFSHDWQKDQDEIDGERCYCLE